MFAPRGGEVLIAGQFPPVRKPALQPVFMNDPSSADLLLEVCGSASSTQESRT